MSSADLVIFVGSNVFSDCFELSFAESFDKQKIIMMQKTVLKRIISFIYFSSIVKNPDCNICAYSFNNGEGIMCYLKREVL